MKLWDKFKQLLYRRFLFNRSNPNKLVWIEENLKEPFCWDYADTVDFDIEAIKTKKEIIWEFEKIGKIKENKRIPIQVR